MSAPASAISTAGGRESENGRTLVEVLLVPDCPNSAEASVRTALGETGHPGAEVGFRLPASVEEATSGLRLFDWHNP